MSVAAGDVCMYVCVGGGRHAVGISSLYAVMISLWICFLLQRSPFSLKQTQAERKDVVRTQRAGHDAGQRDRAGGTVPGQRDRAGTVPGVPANGIHGNVDNTVWADRAR